MSRDAKFQDLGMGSVCGFISMKERQGRWCLAVKGSGCHPSPSASLGIHMKELGTASLGICMKTLEGDSSDPGTHQPAWASA